MANRINPQPEPLPAYHFQLSKMDINLARIAMALFIPATAIGLSVAVFEGTQWLLRFVTSF